MSEIQHLHDETERLLQRSLGANLLFVAYLLDIARLELHRQLEPSDNETADPASLQDGACTRPKAPMH